MIYIRKNGIFYENGYNPEAEAYVFTKVESFIPYLNELIHIDSEITLEDFFNILEKDEDIVNVIFGSHMGHHSLRPYFDEIKQDCIPESQEEMEYIECSWVADQFNYQKYYKAFKNDEHIIKQFGPLRKPEDETNDITIYVDVHGVGKYEPQKDEVYEKGEKIPTDTSYAIEFTPLYRMKHLPIKLNKEFIIREERYKSKERIVIKGEREFTLFEVFGEILSEVTFVGSPEERDEQWKDVSDSIEEMKEKMEEEIREQMEEDPEESDEEDKSEE